MIKKSLVGGLVTLMFLLGMIGIANATPIVMAPGTVVVSAGLGLAVDLDFSLIYANSFDNIFTFEIVSSGAINDVIGIGFVGANIDFVSLLASEFQQFEGAASGSFGTGTNNTLLIIYDSSQSATASISFGLNGTPKSAYWVNETGASTPPITANFISAPVPEPTGMLLFGTGLACLAAARRRKRVS